MYNCMKIEFNTKFFTLGVILSYLVTAITISSFNPITWVKYDFYLCLALVLVSYFCSCKMTKGIMDDRGVFHKREKKK